MESTLRSLGIITQPLAMVDTPTLPHLVVASFKESASGRSMVQLLTKMIRALGTEGAFSVTINRQHGQSVHCAFEMEGDAARLAGAMKAQPIAKYPGWVSQSGFSLDIAHVLAKRLAEESPRKSRRR